MQKNWQLTVRDFITIGIFATLAKSSSLMIALAGGGMNPFTLILKNILMMVLLTALVVKIAKPFALSLSYLCSLMVSVLIMGQGVSQLPIMAVSALTGELIILILGRYRYTWGIICGVFVADLLSKLGALLLSYLAYRENIAMVFPMLVFAAIGLLGTIIGLFFAHHFIKELRHAGLITSR